LAKTHILGKRRGGKLNPVSGHFGAKNQENPTTTMGGGCCSLLPHFSIYLVIQKMHIK
jgi:hypothetical protein